MNIDVALDDLIKSRSNRRLGSANPKTESRRRSNPARSSRGGTEGRRDPLSVPLDNLISTRTRQVTAGRGSRRGVPSRGRRGFGSSIGSGGLRDVGVRVASRASNKRSTSVNFRSNYSKGLAAQVGRDKRRISVPQMAMSNRNLSINRRNGFRVGGAGGLRNMGSSAVQRSRRQLDRSNAGRWTSLGSRNSSATSGNAFRSIAFQSNRGWTPTRGNVPESMPYNTGLGHAAVYRQGSEVASGQVAPPLYDKTVVTGAATSHMEQDSVPVFSENDRSMFSKIKIMAQLDKIPAPNPAQRQYNQHATADSGVGALRYRTLSDRFLS
eukprot:Gregarina_sp_Poly_1__3977@NODE_21_length_20913_cov_102_783268_g19_i0_p7_GENE_NODE_21_length_20913_cov_102_783268_g19_i0NODE_21_length_20913_cov_102_783268_g19_i0_p7_ORF_typecomplete_len324_score30_25_NODE_21_length_20913_cov_102_783268_g19_i0511022